MDQRVITQVGLLYPAKLRKKNRKKAKNGRKSKLRVLKNLFFTYLQKSSIHGLKNLLNPNHNSFQRFFSASVILFCLILAYICMGLCYHTYQEGVHVTVIKTDSLHISSIPFPGIAVCNINSIKRSALVKMADRMKDKAHMTFNETFQILRNLTNEYKLSYVPSKERDLLKYVLEQNGQSNNLSGILTELSHSCDDMMKNCMFNSKVLSCRDIFTQTFLSGGRSCCVSKNSITTYVSGRPTDRPMWHWETNGLMSGMNLKLDLEIKEYMPQSTFLGPTFFGAEVIIFDARSHPSEVSLIGSSFNMASYGEATLIQIDPSVENNTYSTGDDGSVCRRGMPINPVSKDIQSRKKFPYSVSECIFRCLAHQLHPEECNCYLYKHKIHDETRECSLEGWECISRVLKRRMLDDNYEYGYREYLLNQCRCLPACESILYKSTTSTLISDNQSRRSKNETHIYIYCENQFANLYERKPIYTGEQLLVQTIGLCSLFFGGSIVSIVELIYFITLRLLCELYTNQKPEKDEEEKRLDLEEICEGTKEGKIYWNEILANID